MTRLAPPPTVADLAALYAARDPHSDGGRIGAELLRYRALAASVTQLLDALSTHGAIAIWPADVDEVVVQLHRLGWPTPDHLIIDDLPKGGPR